MAQPTVECTDGHINPAGQKYCGECGTLLEGLCPSGHLSPAGQKYCGECGVSLGRIGPPADLEDYDESDDETVWDGDNGETSERELLGQDVQEDPQQSTTPLFQDPRGLSVRQSVSGSKKVLLGLAGMVVGLPLLAVSISNCSTDHAESPEAPPVRYDKPQTTADPSPSTGEVSGDPEQWLDAICRTGLFQDGVDTSSGIFSGALGGGICAIGRNGNGPIYFTQWDSDFKRRNSMAMTQMCSTSAEDISGVIQNFSIAPGATSSQVLQPLERFGFRIQC